MDGIVAIFTRLQSTDPHQLIEADEDSMCFQINVFVDRLLHEGKTAQADWIWAKALELAGLSEQSEKGTEEAGKEIGGGSLLMNYGTYLASTNRYNEAIATFDRITVTVTKHPGVIKGILPIHTFILVCLEPDHYCIQLVPTVHEIVR